MRARDDSLSPPFGPTYGNCKRSTQKLLSADAKYTFGAVFLARKFSPKAGSKAGEPWGVPLLPSARWEDLPELAKDVFSNIQVLLTTRRGFGHIFPGFGLSPSDGLTSREIHVEQISKELPETLARYERRFTPSDIAFDVDERGEMYATVSGTIGAIKGEFQFRFGVANKRVVRIDFKQ